MSGRNGKEPEDWICYPDQWISDSCDVDLRSPPSVVSIFRVPNVLMKDSDKREAYVPTRVSLGPYHNRTAELRPMDIHKRRALHRMISRRFNNVRDLSPNNMDFYNLAKSKILELEKKIRDNYEEKLECKQGTLAQMLCLDGCFILEILRTLSIRDVHKAQARNYYEPLFNRCKIYRTASDIVTDILKLENQVPLIVLQKLLELELNSVEGAKNMLKKMILSIFKFFHPFDYEIDENKWSWPQRDEEKVHLLGLLHTLILFSERGRDEENKVVPSDPDKHIAINDIANIPRAIKLRNAGIKFKRCNGGIKEINFDSNSGTIYLPCIIIADSTERPFRNLIAFEMCKFNSSGNDINYVASYVALMDQLIDTEEDVALLRKRGIVTNFLGSDKAVAEFFNDLGIGVSVNVGRAFNQLTVKVNEYYKKKWNGHFAKLRTEYFSSPWKIIALGATFVLLVLTLLQTVFTIKK